MVAHDCDRLHRQLADPPAVEQVGKAMVEFAHQQYDPARPVTQGKLPLHRKFARQRGKFSPQHLARHCAGVELDPHEEPPARCIVELLRFQHIAAAFEQVRSDPRGDAGPVRTGKGEDKGGGHLHILQLGAWCRKPAGPHPIAGI